MKLENQKARHFGEVLIVDITYIPTKEGWLYLSVVLDLFSRAALGFQTSGAMPATIVTEALDKAVKNGQYQEVYPPSSPIEEVNTLANDYEKE